MTSLKSNPDVSALTGLIWCREVFKTNGEITVVKRIRWRAQQSEVDTDWWSSTITSISLMLTSCWSKSSAACPVSGAVVRGNLVTSSPPQFGAANYRVTLYCQKQSLAHPKQWIQGFQSPPWPQVYETKHRALQTAPANVWERIPRSQELTAWYCDRMPPVQQVPLWNSLTTKYSTHNC